MRTSRILGWQCWLCFECQPETTGTASSRYSNVLLFKKGPPKLINAIEFNSGRVYVYRIALQFSRETNIKSGLRLEQERYKASSFLSLKCQLKWSGYEYVKSYLWTAGERLNRRNILDLSSIFKMSIEDMALQLTNRQPRKSNIFLKSTSEKPNLCSNWKLKDNRNCVKIKKLTEISNTTFIPSSTPRQQTDGQATEQFLQPSPGSERPSERGCSFFLKIALTVHTPVYTMT